MWRCHGDRGTSDVTAGPGVAAADAGTHGLTWWPRPGPTARHRHLGEAHRMTEPAQPNAADPTRDIRLPPLPDRPFPSLPSDWSAAGRTEETPPADSGAKPPAPETPVPSAPGEPTTPSTGPLVDQTTAAPERTPSGGGERI